MKAIKTLCILVMLTFNQITVASIYIIGNDTIHLEFGEYFTICRGDTFFIDTTIIFVKYESYVDGNSREAIETSYHLTLDDELCYDWISYTYANQSFINLSVALNNEQSINMIDFNTSVHYLCDGLYPDDPEYIWGSDQWYLDKIEAPLAWNISTGDPGIIVAILDTGFDWEHEDLGPGEDNYSNIYLNEDENNGGEDPWDEWDDPTSGDGLDNDDNDCTDDWKGWGEMYDAQHSPPFYLGNDVRNYDLQWLTSQGYNNPEALWMHGTLIAGIIGAKTNNGLDIAGIAGGWNSKGTTMILFKTGVSDKQGSMANRIAYGICYAVEKLPRNDKAGVIEMAFETAYTNDVINDALTYAHNQGVFLVAAAGNDGVDDVSFPASHPNVFAVGATHVDDHVREDSNFGDNLDICAPGDNIVHLVPGNETEVNTGRTSAASAMVAATAALMLSVNPELTPEQVTTILHESADKVPYYTYEDGFNYYIGYGRLNTYKAVCQAGEYPYNIELYANETWNSNKSIMNSVYVKDGVTLTITAEIQFDPGASLIIEPGAIVIVDGGTITNMKCCNFENDPWPGIQVWGNKNASQYTPGEHGKLILQNGAVIENAVTAVELWQPGNVNSTGGIIVADSAFFLNNARSIHAVDYRNFNPLNPTLELEYYATFTDCSFIISEEYLGDKTFYKHIDLDRVSGVRFYGCTFLCDHSANNVSEWNTGIASYNAGFKVMPYCHTLTVPCADYDSCRFNGFYWAIGVWAPAMLIDPPVLINHAHFNDNITGVYINQHSYTVILENFLEAGYDDPYTGNCGFASGIGIDIQQSNGFVVENNYLRKNSLAANGNYAGIRVKNCPSELDIIYKNDLVGLSYANFAEGTNRSDYLDDQKGVEYQCNCNSHNAVDFMVEFIEPDTNRAMIRGWHGDKDIAAGNIFSDTLYDALNFSNRGKSTINYYYCDACTDQEPLKIFTWQPEYFEKKVSSENNCPDHYGGGGHIELTMGERQEKEVDFAQNLNDYNAVKALYESLIDGGNSAGELSDIESAEPDDMWALRSQLLGHSPHLSQEVLRAMADRTDVFPDEVLLDILAANPDELNRDTLISYLEHKEDPLPEYMIDILRQAVNGITYKTILENEMAQYHSAKTQAAQDIIRSILFETAFNMTDFRNWLDNMDNMVADRQIISAYLLEGDTTSALALLNLLPTLYSLAGEELADYNDYKSLVEMQITWKAQGKWMNQLDSVDICALEAIASDESSYAGNMARNILTYAGIHQYCDCLPLLDSAYLKNTTIPVKNTRIDKEILKIYAEPNPAHTYVVFKYEFLNDHSTGLITILNANGILIGQIKVNGKKGQKVWNTSGLKAGIYYYRLLSDGFSKAGKIVIQ